VSRDLPGLPGPRLEPTTAGFWLAAGEGRLVVQRCSGCGTHRHPPTEVCYDCGSLDWIWHDQPGTGTVFSYTWTDQPVLPSLADLGPYNISVVELDSTQGVVRLLSRVVDAAREQVRIGLPVVVDFDPVDDQVALPVFRHAQPAHPEEETS
jgi:uncharacterized OB-fold protein